MQLKLNSLEPSLEAGDRLFDLHEKSDLALQAPNIMISVFGAGRSAPGAQCLVKSAGTNSLRLEPSIGLPHLTIPFQFSWFSGATCPANALVDQRFSLKPKDNKRH
jgi:hypothetical protein